MTGYCNYQNVTYHNQSRRFLRNNPTPAEAILWQHLKGRQTGYKFRRQFGIGKYIVDFFCYELKLIIELDGFTHDSDKAKAKDKYRQTELEKQGYKVVRFTNERIYGDIEIIFNEIKSICEQRKRELNLLS